MKKAIAILLISVLTLSVTGCAKETVRPELLESVSTNVDIAIATVRDLSDVRYYNAEVLPVANELSFDRDGYIYGIYVSAGDYVEEGEVLATLVGKDYDMIIALESEIESLEEANEENFAYLEAELELERLSGSDTELMELKLKHEKELAELKLKEKKERLETMRSNDIGYAYITAPYDGIAMAVTGASRGAYLEAGTPICALEGQGTPYISSEFINEKDISALSDYYCLFGDRRVEVEYVPYTKEQLKKLSANSVDLKAIFNITSDASAITVGQYCAIVTEGNRVENVLTVPVNAVYNDATGRYVYKVEGNVKIRQDVVIGVKGSTYVEIVDGLKEGDSVYVKN